MDDTLQALLDELYRFGAEHDLGRADRLQRLRNVEPDTARVLAVLVRATGAKRLLEIGTSNGFSTLWLANAACDVGGHLISVDVDATRSAMAAQNLNRANLRELVELRVEDAAVTLGETPDESLDMIFLDAERPAYASYWPDLLRVLKPGGLLAVDNVISHADQLEGFRSLIHSEEGVSEAIVPTGAGLLLVVRDLKRAVPPG